MIPIIQPKQSWNGLRTRMRKSLSGPANSQTWIPVNSCENNWRLLFTAALNLTPQSLKKIPNPHVQSCYRHTQQTKHIDTLGKTPWFPFLQYLVWLRQWTNSQPSDWHSNYKATELVIINTATIILYNCMHNQIDWVQCGAPHYLWYSRAVANRSEFGTTLIIFKSFICVWRRSVTLFNSCNVGSS